jgi:hypothetical protein
VRRGRGGCLLYSEVGGVLPTSAASLVGACRFPAASPIPRWNVPSAELLITEHAKIHSHLLTATLYVRVRRAVVI